VAIGTKTGIRTATVLIIAGTVRYGQSEGVDRNPSSPDMPMQWCWPPARQQAGTDAGLASASGATTLATTIASTAMEMPRLTTTRILARHISRCLLVVNDLRQTMLILRHSPRSLPVALFAVQQESLCYLIALLVSGSIYLRRMSFMEHARCCYG
jgi:hypothetical protein